MFRRMLGMAVLMAGSAVVQAAGGMASLESAHSVADTMDRLEQKVTAAGFRVFARVDHGAGAKSVDMPLRPTQLLIFGNPKGGTVLLQSQQTVGIDLPLKILVWQDGETTRIGYIEPEELAEEYDIDEDHKVIKTMEGALDKLTDAAIAQ